MICRLLPIANSKTATLGLIAGLCVIMASRFATVRRHLWAYALGAIVLLILSDASFRQERPIVEMSGRDATLTGRTGLWETLLREPIDPVVGVGYASFWLGERLTRFWAMYPTSPPIEAHNGYLEVYINLGLIGVCLIAGVLWGGLRRIARGVAVVPSQCQRRRMSEHLRCLAQATASLISFTTSRKPRFRDPIFFIIFLILAFDYRDNANRCSPSPVQPLWRGSTSDAEEARPNETRGRR